MELSENRAELDQTELFVYGFCSAQIYTDYRETVDKKLKFTMIQLAKYYEEYTDLDKEFINEMLLKQYCKFWADAEPSLQKFYEDIQEILALPPLSTLPKDISPTNAFYAPEIKTLEAEIAHLQDKYVAETYFLHELKHRRHIVESICQPLKEKVHRLLKTDESNLKKAEYLQSSNEKRSAMMEKFMDNIDKKTYLKFIAGNFRCNVGSNDKEDITNKLKAVMTEEKKCCIELRLI